MKVKHKMILATALLLIFPYSSYAQDDHLSFCKVISTSAKLIMEYRQSGKPMSKLIDLANEQPSILKDTFINITVKAYEIPRFSTDEAKRKTVEDFVNDVYLDCLKNPPLGKSE